ncbi:hypothetical protein M0657_004988 [Pyricularia oryzae]|uniref:Uncharacterized protein n=1 Tax=Pyricularia oryzae TaxID=318829 RepID=A0A4P7NJD0_PYROR|nr:hypothetical protein M9X92_006870 [Pyricularia oryzae]KAI7923672.1 hypothetical protein M0657_004988 [Pyricularia oryzae]QBZ62171.1 hypothetical protein PoMZ_11047 [Pyricularia oryzae]
MKAFCLPGNAGGDAAFPTDPGMLDFSALYYGTDYLEPAGPANQVPSPRLHPRFGRNDSCWSHVCPNSGCYRMSCRVMNGGGINGTS